MKLRRANTPHHGLGEFGRVKRKAGTKDGAHVRQRDHSGYDDRKGYRNSAQADFGSKHSGRAPAIPREAGNYHPIGHGSSRQFSEDARETLRMNREVLSHAATERREGKHTGEPSRGDTNVRKGPQGNGEGSAAPGVGKGAGVRGTPDSHLGTAGRGAPGRVGKADHYHGKPKSLPEHITHDQFEKLGAG